MDEFYKQFIESDGKPIMYNGQELIALDRLNVPKNFELLVRLISTNSEWRQGIRLSVNKGKLISNVDDKRLAGTAGKKFVIWEEFFDVIPEDRYIGKSTDGQLVVYNSWQRRTELEGSDSWFGNAAMIKKEIRKDVYRYECNDGHLDYNFDDIIFEIEIKELNKKK